MAYVEYVVEGMRNEAKLDRTEVTFGRSPECTVHLPHDPELSRQHCAIRQSGDGKHILCDMGSSNGTFINDDKLQEEHILAEGDRIRIGRTILVFRSEAKGFQTQIFDEVEDRLNKGAGFHTIMRDILKKRR